MKAVWISEVVLLISFVELGAATSVSKSSCLKRNLTVTVDDILRLYVDGIEITNLPNANIAFKSDVVPLPCTTRLIAIHGRDKQPVLAGILASTNDDYVLTNSSWKCSNVSHSGWEEINFDDSSWMSAVEYNGEIGYQFMPEFSTNAKWIWLRQDTSRLVALDVEVYCRKRTGFDECHFGQPINECDPSMGRCISLTTGYNCSCNPGYQNEGQHKCKGLSNNSTLPPAASDAVIILGVLLGVSFLIIVALIVALSIVCSRTSTSKDPDCTGEKVETPKDEVDNETYEDLEMSDVNDSNRYEQIRKASHI